MLYPILGGILGKRKFLEVIEVTSLSRRNRQLRQARAILTIVWALAMETLRRETPSVALASLADMSIPSQKNAKIVLPGNRAH